MKDEFMQIMLKHESEKKQKAQKKQRVADKYSAEAYKRGYKNHNYGKGGTANEASYRRISQNRAC